MFQRFETLVLIFAACVFIAVTAYVFFASRADGLIPQDHRAQQAETGAR